MASLKQWLFCALFLLPCNSGCKDILTVKWVFLGGLKGGLWIGPAFSCLPNCLILPQFLFLRQILKYYCSPRVSVFFKILFSSKLIHCQDHNTYISEIFLTYQVSAYSVSFYQLILHNIFNIICIIQMSTVQHVQRNVTLLFLANKYNSTKTHHCY